MLEGYWEGQIPQVYCEGEDTFAYDTAEVIRLTDFWLYYSTIPDTNVNMCIDALENSFRYAMFGSMVIPPLEKLRLNSLLVSLGLLKKHPGPNTLDKVLLCREIRDLPYLRRIKLITSYRTANEYGLNFSKYMVANAGPMVDRYVSNTLQGLLSYDYQTRDKETEVITIPYEYKTSLSHLILLLGNIREEIGREQDLERLGNLLELHALFLHSVLSKQTQIVEIGGEDYKVDDMRALLTDQELGEAGLNLYENQKYMNLVEDSELVQKAKTEISKI